MPPKRPRMSIILTFGRENSKSERSAHAQVFDVDDFSREFDRTYSIFEGICLVETGFITYFSINNYPKHNLVIYYALVIALVILKLLYALVFMKTFVI